VFPQEKNKLSFIKKKLVNLLCGYNIWLFCQISKSISPYGLPEGASSCPQISKFLGCPKPDFFSSLPKLLPQTTARMLGLKLIWQSHKVMWTTWQK
jgi:hypothetical protein